MATKKTSTTRRKRPAKTAKKPRRAAAPGNRSRAGVGERDSNGRFTPGKSGNPDGRPKADHRLRDLAREHTDEAITGLLKLARTAKSESAAVAAWREILDRGWGRAPQSLEHSGKDGAPLPAGIMVGWAEPPEREADE